MRILWLCRWFGNYRIPVYKELNRLTNGQFYMAYSKDAVTPLVHRQMRDALGDNAIALEKEKHFTIGKLDSNFANSYIDIPYQSGLLNAISKVNPDIIISDGFFQWTFAAVLKSYRRKVCVFYERTEFVERNAPKWRILYRKLIGKFIDGFLINGSLTRKYLDNMGFTQKPKVEGCMVADCEGLSKAVESCPESVKSNLKKSLDIQDEGLIFLFVGQLVERKGIKELLSGWSEHLNNFPDDTIIVAGQGVLGKELQNIYKNEKSIKFVGQVSYDHIAEYLAIADISVMPTLEDNWSLVVPEAMACSKPVATTPYNGCHIELIEEGKNGYVFDPLEKSSIVKMLAAFHNANLSNMGKRSKEIIANYTPLTAATGIFELCQKITK
ncbi:MAG: glycosyltransferase family 4 protein [Alistipes sp.]|uniref:glycosyltransferase family 4 protein n=1 Tax=Alistipes sp. TaxID=1872444 RepID=UPI0023F38E55|nr:glycosyltransferase family 4 protein [Alistipes sp.]MBQ7892665.1 glycosyltransferase family 4 protein [Alistipes sp.]